jgi:hypothetical protein
VIRVVSNGESGLRHTRSPALNAAILPAAGLTAV